MKPFRLATMLKLLEQSRDQRQVLLADAIQAEVLLNQRLQKIDDQMQQNQIQTSELVQETAVNPDHWADHQRYGWVLQAQRTQLVEQRGTLQQEIERRKQALMEADREVKKLEKMRERQILEEMTQQKNREQKELDDQSPWKFYSRRTQRELQNEELS